MAKGNDILTHETVADFRGVAGLMPRLAEMSVITVACHPDDFSASALARAVEDSDAHLVNLNITGTRLDDGRITVELRTNHRNCGATARSLERYGYDVIALTGGADDDAGGQADDTLRFRAAELLHIINI